MAERRNQRGNSLLISGGRAGIYKFGDAENRGCQADVQGGGIFFMITDSRDE